MAQHWSEGVGTLRFTGREHQQELVEAGRAAEGHNLLTCPPQKDAAFVALKLLQEMAQQIRRPERLRSVVIVQQRRLSSVQNDITQLTDLKAATVAGVNDKRPWQLLVKEYQVLVVTSVVLDNMLSENVLPMSRINLIIIEECHSIVSDLHLQRVMSAYSWYKNSLRKDGAANVPRIIAFTYPLFTQEFPFDGEHNTASAEEYSTSDFDNLNFAVEEDDECSGDEVNNKAADAKIPTSLEDFLEPVAKEHETQKEWLEMTDFNYWRASYGRVDDVPGIEQEGKLDQVAAVTSDSTGRWLAYSKLGYQLEKLERMLMCRADMAADIVGLKKITGKPREVILETRTSPTSGHCLSDWLCPEGRGLYHMMKSTVHNALAFLNDHRYDPTEIYGDEAFGEELRAIPDPVLDPKSILEQFLYVLDQAGPYAADKAAFALLVRIEKLKVRIPYERHFLLLCLVTSALLKVRAACDAVFQSCTNDTERIKMFTSPKVLRLMDVFTLFKPEKNTTEGSRKNTPVRRVDSKTDNVSKKVEKIDRKNINSVQNKLELGKESTTINIPNDLNKAVSDDCKTSDKVQEIVMKDDLIQVVIVDKESKVCDNNSSQCIDKTCDENGASEDLRSDQITRDDLKSTDAKIQELEMCDFKSLEQVIERTYEKLADEHCEGSGLKRQIHSSDASRKKMKCCDLDDCECVKGGVEEQSVKRSHNSGEAGFVLTGNETYSTDKRFSKTDERATFSNEPSILTENIKEENLNCGSLIQETNEQSLCNVPVNNIEEKNDLLKRERVTDSDKTVSPKKRFVEGAPRRVRGKGQRGNYNGPNRHNWNDPDALCGLIFVDEPLMAKILCSLINEYCRADPELHFVCAQYTVDKVADPQTEPREAETEHRLQEDVLKRFRTHEFNVLVGTAILEEGMDLPKCNLVVRWDPPRGYRCYARCRARARAPRSLYALMAPPDPSQLVTALAQYMHVERMLVRKCRWTEPGALEEAQAARFTPLVEPYRPQNSTVNAAVTLAQAVQLVNRYCAKLPSDTFTRLVPLWCMESVQYRGHQLYVCSVRLPINCPLKHQIVGHPMPTRVLSRRIAALQVCRALHLSGELDDNLMPIGKENFKALEPDWLSLPPSSDMPAANDNSTEPRPGTTKRKQYYYKKVAEALRGCRPRLGRPCLAYEVRAHLAVPLPERHNTRGRRLHPPEDYKEGFAILTSKPIHQIPVFPLFTRSGEVRVELARLPLRPVLGPRRQMLIHSFMRYTFRVVLRVHNHLMLFHPKSSYYVVPTTKVMGADGINQVVIDWPFLELIHHHTETSQRPTCDPLHLADTSGSSCNSKNVEVNDVPTATEDYVDFLNNIKPDDQKKDMNIETQAKEKEEVARNLSDDAKLHQQETVSSVADKDTNAPDPKDPEENSAVDAEGGEDMTNHEDSDMMQNPYLAPGEVFVFDSEKYRDAVVMPWYRNQDQPLYFYVAEICWQLSPLSCFPSSLHHTFRDYYHTKYGVTITQPNQPLLDVDHTSARLNLLTPRFVNRKGVTLPTSSERTKRAKRERLEKKQILVPELCGAHPFRGALWRAAVALPCVLYRINSLLLADEIRRSVAAKLALGQPRPPPDFHWPPLDFGWSLADVLKEKEETKDGQKSNADEKRDDESEKPKDPDASAEDTAVPDAGLAAADAPADGEKTANDLVKEGEDAEKGEGVDVFEVGTWSNEMAANVPPPHEGDEAYYDEGFDEMMAATKLPGNVTMCTSKNGGTDWNLEMSPRHTPRHSHGHQRKYSVADSDASYVSSDFDVSGGGSNFSDIDSDDDDYTGETNQIPPDKGGIRIQFKSGNEAEAIEVVEPAPKAGEGEDQEGDKERAEEERKRGEDAFTHFFYGQNLTEDEPTKTYIRKFHDDISINENDIITNGVLVRHDQPITSIKMQDFSETIPFYTSRNDNKGYHCFRMDTVPPAIEEHVKENNSSCFVENHVRIRELDQSSEKNTVSNEDNNSSKNCLSSTKIINKTNEKTDETNEDVIPLNDKASLVVRTDEDHVNPFPDVYEKALSKDEILELFRGMFPCEECPAGLESNDGILRNGWVELDALEDNKRRILEEVRRSMPKDEWRKYNFFAMKDFHGDEGFEKCYEDVVKARKALECNNRDMDMLERNRGTDFKTKEGGPTFSFDYQPDLSKHPGPSPSVILQALTMSNANDGINLERLETIGDSFLKYAITTYLYCTYQNIHEGKLSHLRSKQVSNLNLYRLGRRRCLGGNMVACKFEPHDNWLPPCHKVPPHLETALIETHIPSTLWNVADMPSLESLSKEEVERLVRERVAQQHSKASPFHSSAQRTVHETTCPLHQSQTAKENKTELNVKSDTKDGETKEKCKEIDTAKGDISIHANSSPEKGHIVVVDTKNESDTTVETAIKKVEPHEKIDATQMDNTVHTERSPVKDQVAVVDKKKETDTTKNIQDVKSDVKGVEANEIYEKNDTASRDSGVNVNSSPEKDQIAVVDAKIESDATTNVQDVGVELNGKCEESNTAERDSIMLANGSSEKDQNLVVDTKNELDIKLKTAECVEISHTSDKKKEVSFQEGSQATPTVSDKEREPKDIESKCTCDQVKDDVSINEPMKDFENPSFNEVPCFVPYNLITQHSIPDKSVADCVEALIGAYLIECGPRGALLFMAWLGIRVLPRQEVLLGEDHPYVKMMEAAAIQLTNKEDAEKGVGFKGRNIEDCIESAKNNDNRNELDAKELENNYTVKRTVKNDNRKLTDTVVKTVHDNQLNIITIADKVEADTIGADNATKRTEDVSKSKRKKKRNKKSKKDLSNVCAVIETIEKCDAEKKIENLEESFDSAVDVKDSAGENQNAARISGVSEDDFEKEKRVECIVEDLVNCLKDNTKGNRKVKCRSKTRDETPPSWESDQLDVDPEDWADSEEDNETESEMEEDDVDEEEEDSRSEGVWWEGRQPGSLVPYKNSQGRWVQVVFGELQSPPSPLLRHVPDPEGELNQMLSGYEELERTLGYRFSDRSYLLQAMTHASHTPNRLTDCYQRLEFLGDAVLDYLITRQLYEDPRRHSPGALTDLRSALVNNTIFASLAVRHGMHKFFRHLSPGLNEVLARFVKIQEENGHSISEEHYLIQEDECEQAEDVEVPKALGDLFESVAGAIFLDSGMSLDAVWKVYHALMKREMEMFSESVPKSPVRELLEMEPETAKFGKPEKLADGRRVRVTVEVLGAGAFKGVGRNFRIAKCTAAKCALRHLGRNRQNKNKL